MQILGWLAALLLAQQDGGRRGPPAPGVGKEAPDFALKTLDSKTEATLSKLRGKPVFLIFGGLGQPPSPPSS